MKLKVLCAVIGVLVVGLGGPAIAYANEVLFTANQPMKIVFREAHKNQNSQTVLGELQTIGMSKNVTIPVSLNNYDKAGVVIVSVNDHELPTSANQFDQPGQCSMTTDKTKANGVLAFTLSKHSINCRSYGGVFY
jgi:hypothetical protein